MGDIKTTTAAIVAKLIADTELTDNVLTSAAGTLDQVLASDSTTFPAILVTYAGGDYGENAVLARRVDVERSWTIYAIAKATGPSKSPSDDAADMLERVVALLLGVTVDGGQAELWPESDELAHSSRGVVAYSLDIKANTRTVGV